jgi:hypothetical protein
MNHAFVVNMLTHAPTGPLQSPPGVGSGCCVPDGAGAGGWSAGVVGATPRVITGVTPPPRSQQRYSYPGLPGAGGGCEAGWPAGVVGCTTGVMTGVTTGATGWTTGFTCSHQPPGKVILGLS